VLSSRNRFTRIFRTSTIAKIIIRREAGGNIFALFMSVFFNGITADFFPSSVERLPNCSDFQQPETAGLALKKIRTVSWE